MAVHVPVLGEPEGEQQERHLHPLMKHLIDEFGDREGVLELPIYSNMHSFGWTGLPHHLLRSVRGAADFALGAPHRESPSLGQTHPPQSR